MSPRSAAFSALPGPRANICETILFGPHNTTTEQLSYWNWRNTFVDILAVLIVFFNSVLIYVILNSQTLRKQVHWYSAVLSLTCYVLSSSCLQRFNLIMVSLACTDLGCGIVIPFNTLRVCRWGDVTPRDT